ncbi:MAG: type II secretion system F family protein, partial [Candidatus Micrarchaeota archaeon]
ELSFLKIKIPFNHLLFYTLIISSAMSAVLFFTIQTDYLLKIAMFLSTLLLPPSLLYFFLDYLHDRKQKRIDAELPDALFQIAAFPKDTPMEKIIETVANKDSVLGREFRKADNLIKAGFPTEEAIGRIAGTNDSILLKRSISLALEAYGSGGNLSAPLNEIAQDIFEMQSLQKEAAAGFSMQKYTLLAGVAILIPLILGLLLSVIGALQFDTVDSIFQLKNSPELLPTVIVAVQVYIFLLSIISSAFVSLQEGKIKKAPLYFSMLFPCSLLVFNVVKGINFV